MSVRRTGVGSDYEVDSDLVDESGEVLFVLDDGSGGVLIEVKATTVPAVRMTRTQAERAVKDADRFSLCVVPVAADKPILIDDVARTARFVIDIGHRLSFLTSEVRGLDILREAATLRQGELEVLMMASDVRFRVGSAAWEGGLTIEQFAAHVTSRRQALQRTDAPPS